MKIQTTSVITRSVFALSLGCAFSLLPLLSAQAQEASPAPTAANQIVPPQESSAGEVVPAKENGAAKPVKPLKGAKNDLSIKEKSFMRKAAGGNAAEVQLGELALKNGESQEIKDFAQKMITDHTQANEELTKLAQDEGLFNFKVEVSDADKATYAKMTVLKGTAFDTAYAKHAVADHETDLKEYKSAMTYTKDAGLMAYEKKVEPTVEEHLKMAKALEDTKSAVVNH